jgi:hypothetical protein
MYSNQIGPFDDFAVISKASNLVTRSNASTLNCVGNTSAAHFLGLRGLSMVDFLPRRNVVRLDRAISPSRHAQVFRLVSADHVDRLVKGDASWRRHRTYRPAAMYFGRAWRLRSGSAVDSILFQVAINPPLVVGHRSCRNSGVAQSNLTAASPSSGFLERHLGINRNALDRSYTHSNLN